MNKGFSLFETRFGEREVSFSEGLCRLSGILMDEIGGSMGPIYGTLFMEMGEYAEDAGPERIGLSGLAGMLHAGLEGLYEIVEAREGDKTLVDCLAPADRALQEAARAETDFAEALSAMKKAAERGRDATKELAAKFGRSSRLGERSRGVLDAGACSCCLLLTAMADGICTRLAEEERGSTI